MNEWVGVEVGLFFRWSVVCVRVRGGEEQFLMNAVWKEGSE